MRKRRSKGIPQNFSIELGKENDTGPCECCGQMSRTVWGYLSVDAVARAVYYVQWTLGEVKKHGANVDLVIGDWTKEATPAKRVAVSIVYRIGPNGPEFASIDPDHRPHANAGLADHFIPGRNVLGNPIAADSYAFVHAIFGQDPRLAELIQAAQ
ncbi:MAG TPA: hypothetical protein VFX30_00980 [bacterium]|nr:hypothetical protein [bacterium]